MKVRMLKNWSFYKSGELVEVFDPTAKAWILDGIAEEATDRRSLPVEQAISCQQHERAESRPQKKRH